MHGPATIQGTSDKGKEKARQTRFAHSAPVSSPGLAIKGTLNERTCLPRLAAIRADGMRGFRVPNWLEGGGVIERSGRVRHQQAGDRARGLALLDSETRAVLGRGRWRQPPLTPPALVPALALVVVLHALFALALWYEMRLNPPRQAVVPRVRLVTHEKPGRDAMSCRITKRHLRRRPPWPRRAPSASRSGCRPRRRPMPQQAPRPNRPSPRTIVRSCSTTATGCSTRLPAS